MKENDFKNKVEEFEARKELTAAPECKSLPPHHSKRRRAAAARKAAAAAPIITPPPASTTDAEEVAGMSSIMKGGFWALVFLLGVAVCGLIYYAGVSSQRHQAMQRQAAYFGAPGPKAPPYASIQRPGSYDGYAVVSPEAFAESMEMGAVNPAAPQMMPVPPTPPAVRMTTPSAAVTPQAAAPMAGAAPVVVYFFDTDVDQIPENATLNELAAIAARTGRDIVIKAYADPSGSDAYNQRLSDRRAAAVSRYMQRHGIKRSDISAKGYGETNAYATPALDRRAEITLN